MDGRGIPANPTTESRCAEQAIVFSDRGWSTHNVPERMALALSRAGWRVLYCTSPATFLRRRGERRSQLADNVEGLLTRNLGTRLDLVPIFRRWQAGFVVEDVLEESRQRGFERPAVIYSHGGKWLLEVARAFKARGVFLVHVCMDHLGRTSEDFAEASDLTLVIPKTVYHRLRARFGEKVRWIPQLGPDLDGAGVPGPTGRAVEALERVPRPRLGYFGPPGRRLHKGLLAEVLGQHPEWHFVACGPVEELLLPNLHTVGWISPAELREMASMVDVGFMPYDCANRMNLHCVPLKLFDYFAAGLPVVSTPLIHLWEYGDLVHLGDSPDELADGIRRALAEPTDDPRRERRRRIARTHSIEEFSLVLPAILTGAAGSGD